MVLQWRSRALSALLVTFVWCLAYSSRVTAQAQGVYVLVDAQRIEEIPEPESYSSCTLEEFTATSAQLKYFNQSMYGDKPTQEVRTHHVWSALPSVIRPGQDVPMTLSIRADVLSGAYQEISFGASTRLRVDTNEGGPYFTNYQVNKPVAVEGTPGTSNFPNGRQIEESLTFQVGSGFTNLYITVSAGVAGPAGGVYTRYIYERRDSEPPPSEGSSAGGTSAGGGTATGGGAATPGGGSTTAGGVDITGTWQTGSGGASWTFTPTGNGQYTAVQNGGDNAQGTAVVTGNAVQVSYTTPNGVTGQQNVTVSSDGQSATGNWSDSRPASGATSWVNTGSSGAATGIVLEAERRQVRVGETVTVPVRLVRGAGIANMNFNVRYNPSVAQAATATRGALLPRSMLFEGNPGEQGIARLGFAGSSDLSGTGPVAHLTFKAVGRPGDRSPLRLEVTTVSGMNGSRATVGTVDGEVAIIASTAPGGGDSDGDGDLTAVDAMNALKMSVRLIPERAAADIDTDGQVTSTDARLILQRVVGK